MLRRAKDEGVPDLALRHNVLETQTHIMNDPTPYGPLLVSLDVNGIRVEAVHPLAKALESVQGSQRLLADGAGIVTSLPAKSR